MRSIEVGSRCPGCGVICAGLEVDHLDACPYQGRDALLLIAVGPFYCVSCGRTCASTAGWVNGEPACPSCGAALELQGEGDDDPDPLL